MTIETALNFIPAFVLAFFRLAGMMVMSPLFGSARVPRRVKLLFTLIATMAMVPAIPPGLVLPPTLPELTLAIASELCFGIAMGLIVSMTFYAAQWAGEMIGQQIGFNLSEVFDPAFGQAGTLIGDLYFMLTLIIFLVIGGHRALMQGVYDSFAHAPLMSLQMTPQLFDAFVGLFTGATTLAMRLAAPMFCTMLVVDLAMGCVGRAMPQFNIMTAGLPIKSLIGIIILIAGVGLSADALQGALEESLSFFYQTFTAGAQGG